MKYLDKIFKNKKFLKQYHDDLLVSYDSFMQTTQDELKPSVKQNYVGLEIECFTELEDIKMRERLIECDLESNICRGEDASIEPDFGKNVEFRILFKEKDLKETMKKLSKFFKKGFGVNDTCGLHVHLDMRHRNVNKCFEKLLKFQDVLFSLVDKNRWNNNFCVYTTGYNIHDRYCAINKQAYKKHKTIEIRLHHATLNTEQVEKWVKLLLTILNDPTPPPEFNTKNDVLVWARHKREIKSYVQKQFKNDWFKKKKEQEPLKGTDPWSDYL